MKQYITAEQLKEINISQISKLLGKSEEYVKFMYEAAFYTEFSIGKMIEILDNLDGRACYYIENNPGTKTWKVSIVSSLDVEIEKPELCDCLWEVVKTLL